MKLLCISDFHLRQTNPQNRKDNFFLSQLEKIKFILELAKKENCTGILQAGDFFDTPRPSYFLVQTYIKLFKQYNIPIYSIYGQHDLYLHNDASKDKTALKVMESTELVTILNLEPFILQEQKDNLKICLYGSSFNQEIPKIKKMDNSINILVIHKMILNKKLWEKQENFEYISDFIKKYPKFDFFLLGDYHYAFEFKTKNQIAINTGCLVRKTISKMDLELKPCCYIFNTDLKEIKKYEIPHLLVEDAFVFDNINKKENIELEEFVNNLQINSNIFSFSFEENLNNYLLNNKVNDEIIKILGSIKEEILQNE